MRQYDLAAAALAVGCLLGCQRAASSDERPAEHERDQTPAVVPVPPVSVEPQAALAQLVDARLGRWQGTYELRQLPPPNAGKRPAVAPVPVAPHRVAPGRLELRMADAAAFSGAAHSAQGQEPAWTLEGYWQDATRCAGNMTELRNPDPLSRLAGTWHATLEPSGTLRGTVKLASGDGSTLVSGQFSSKKMDAAALDTNPQGVGASPQTE